MKYLASVFSLMLSVFFVYAQQDVPELETAVVSATLQTQKQKETGRNITVIKGEYFSALPVHSLDELLRYLPGVEVQQRGPQGAQSDIVIRGGTFQQVIVLIDGIRLNDPLTGHFNSYIPIHPDEIDRIEILKGAASAIYGSDAVGGVIHIFSKTFSGKKQNKNSLKAKAVAGEYELTNASGYFNLEKNKTTISGSVLSNHANGQRLRGTTGFFDLTTTHLALSQELSKNLRLNFRSAADFRSFNAQNFYTTFASDTAEEKVNSWWNHLNLQTKTPKGVLNFDVGYKRLRDRFWFNPASKPNDNRTTLFTSQVYYTAPVAAHHGMTLGVQAYQKRIRSNDRGNHNLWHGALYTVFKHQLGNGLHLNESIRMDIDQSYGIVFVPQVNFSWSPSDITVRASAGRSIRDADFTERYNNYNRPLVTSGRIGNPDLEAEQSWSYEAGIDYRLSSKLKISATAFYRDHTDLIDWAPTPYANMPRKENLSPTGSYALAKNVESIQTKGVEIDLVYSEKFNDAVSLISTAGFTWLDSENDDAIPSFYISSHAKYLVNFSSALTVRSFSFSFTGLYKQRNGQKAAAIGAEITPSYFILNGKIGFHPRNKKVNLFLQADNIFDKIYSDLLGSSMPGRWLSGGIEIAL